MRRYLLIVGLICGLLFPATSSADSVFLGTHRAAQYMHIGLARHFGNSFLNAYARRVRCPRRVARGRVDCVMSWVIGDSSYQGYGQIWITYQHHVAHWNYAYRIRRLDEYCAIVEHGDHCTRNYVVR